MSDVVERNDVSIDKIFGWGRVFEVVDPKGGEAIALVYMKLLGDADLNRARVYALRKSSEMRRKLKDENSDERVAWVKSFDEVQKEDLVSLITLFSGREISQKAKDSAKLPTPKPPKSNAGLEKMEKFQKDVDDYPKKRAKAIHKAIEAEVEALQNSLNEKSKDELYKEYVKLLVDEYCEREALVAFEDMQTYLGCYKDDTYKSDKRFFSEFDEFDNLEPTVKVQFKDAYRSLDIDMSELKKLRRATL